jgi:hypothetical protein
MTRDRIEFVHMHTADESIRHIFQGSPYLEPALEYRNQVDYSPFIKDMTIEQGLKDLLIELKPEFGLAVASDLTLVAENTVLGMPARVIGIMTNIQIRLTIVRLLQ